MALPDSLFVSATLQTRLVKMPDGSHVELHFRELPAVEFRRFQLAEGSDNDDVRAASISRLIVASLASPDGTPALTLADAARLKGSAANAILAAILDVNGFAEKKSADPALGDLDVAHPGAGAGGQDGGGVAAGDERGGV
jgi:hypothetical protein